MALALSLHFDATASRAVRGIWSALAAAGVSRDMLDLGYPPHVTLLVLDDETHAKRLQAGLGELAPLVPHELQLAEVRQFPENSVVWIECLGDLAPLHRVAADLVPPESINPHYRPGAWTPHMTLQVAGDARRALELARPAWRPTSAFPVKLEVASFPPPLALGGVDVGWASVRRSGWLPVGDGHQLYWEDAGNPDGVPALILHGGPGSGFSASARRFFDPRRYRVIGFDQRNAGRSTPSAAEADVDLSTNTTAHLVADIERLRLHFGVDRWVIHGSSWGATLGLAYAEAHPERVRAMALAGVTTTRRSEIDWLYRGLAPLFPAEWERFRAGVPAGTPEDGMIAAYHALLFDADPLVRERAARAFHDWDHASASVNAQAGRPSDRADPRYMLARGRIVTHYFRHGAWLEEGQLLQAADRLAGIPGVLVQGRLDLQGPLVTAWELARAWPGARLVVVEGAGHSTGDDGMAEAIVAALDSIVAQEKRPRSRG